MLTQTIGNTGAGMLQILEWRWQYKWHREVREVPKWPLAFGVNPRSERDTLIIKDNLEREEITRLKGGESTLKDCFCLRKFRWTRAFWWLSSSTVKEGTNWHWAERSSRLSSGSNAIKSHDNTATNIREWEWKSRENTAKKKIAVKKALYSKVVKVLCSRFRSLAPKPYKK